MMRYAQLILWIALTVEKLSYHIICVMRVGTTKDVKLLMAVLNFIRHRPSYTITKII